LNNLPRQKRSTCFLGNDFPESLKKYLQEINNLNPHLILSQVSKPEVSCFADRGTIDQVCRIKHFNDTSIPLLISLQSLDIRRLGMLFEFDGGVKNKNSGVI